MIKDIHFNKQIVPDRVTNLVPAAYCKIFLHLSQDQIGWLYSKKKSMNLFLPEFISSYIFINHICSI